MRPGSAVAALLLLAATPALADPHEGPFAGQVQGLTGDWQVEDWDDGMMKLHPDRYTWQSDIHLTIFAPEPAQGRGPTEIARAHFQDYELDDDILDPTRVDLAGATEIMPGVIVQSYRWVHGFDENFSMFGALLRDDGMAIPFHSNCELDRPDAHEPYGEERCLQAISQILVALRGAEGIRLDPPEPPAPISVAGWQPSYDASGATILGRSNFHGTTTATVIVSPPQKIAPDQLQSRIREFSDGLVDEFDDQVEDDPGTLDWVGSAADPWVRRVFPEAFSGPSIVMAGALKAPDGKLALIGVRCPNEGWMGSCAYAVEQARQQIGSGQAEARRAAIIRASAVVIPGDGLKPAALEAAYLHGEQGFGASGITYEFEPLLLFRDGSACRCFDRALALIRPAQDQAEAPENWGRWTRAGDSITIAWPEGEPTSFDADPATLLAGGDARTRIEGDFTHTNLGGNPMMGSSFISQHFFSFALDGSFSSDNASSFQVTTGNAANPDTYAAGGSSGAGPRGVYEIDGHDMKLTYPDGRVQWMGFAQYATEAGTPQKSLLVLDGVAYSRDSD